MRSESSSSISSVEPWKGLQVTQTELPKGKVMSPACACVDDAAGWTDALVGFARKRGEADPIAAVARKGRVSRHAVWALMYRRPKRIGAEIYLALGRLYEDECGRQATKYAEERARTHAKTRLGQAFVRTADELVREEVSVRECD